MITLESMKEALGIPADDTSHDEELQSAITKTYGLMWTYIGYDLSATGTEQLYQYTGEQGHCGACCTNQNFIHVSYWPIIDVVEVRDVRQDAVVPPESYRVVKGPGRIEWYNGSVPANELDVKYHAGYNPLPFDLDMVAQNLATSVYNNGGSLETASSPLKSLTMFDAMSMSFDTGTATTGAQGMLDAWKFVLDKYAVNRGPVLR